MKNDHRQWLYHAKKDARIFEKGEMIEDGWYYSPNLKDENKVPVVVEPPKPTKKKYVYQMSKDELEDEAVELGVDLSDCSNNSARGRAIMKARQKAKK